MHVRVYCLHLLMKIKIYGFNDGLYIHMQRNYAQRKNNKNENESKRQGNMVKENVALKLHSMKFNRSDQTIVRGGNTISEHFSGKREQTWVNYAVKHFHVVITNL